MFNFTDIFTSVIKHPQDFIGYMDYFTLLTYITHLILTFKQCKKTTELSLFKYLVLDQPEANKYTKSQRNVVFVWDAYI